MSLEFLKIHYLLPKARLWSEEVKKGMYTPVPRHLTACGRWAPDWARRTTEDMDYVTCDPCLDVLTRALIQELGEVGMSTSEILDRRA